jgi:transaldolase
VNTNRLHLPLAELSAAGVSVWLDELSRELLAGGELESLIADRHVVGVTTNPTVFASALSEGERYDEQLRELARSGTELDEALFAITTTDARTGCEMLRPVHDRTDGVDGRVSIEIDPRLARDTDAIVYQTHALWDEVGQPNLMVKIPATAEGLPAITAAITQGISVNITLIFSLERYRQVINAFATGLEQAWRSGRDLSAIHSVASFFVSRVDTEVDRKLDAIGGEDAVALKGKAAVANARLAHQIHEDFLAGSRWQRLAAAGARPQRPLWTSTGVKDPSYPDTMYVTELVVPGTVNTMSGNTLSAFADHGAVTGDTVHGSYEAAREYFEMLRHLGVSYQDVTETLEREGMAKFEASWDELSRALSLQLHADVS